jgi:hypothetical protein
MPTNVTEKRIRLGGGNVEFEGTIAATKGGEAVSNTAQEVRLIFAATSSHPIVPRPLHPATLLSLCAQRIAAPPQRLAALDPTYSCPSPTCSCPDQSPPRVPALLPSSSPRLPCLCPSPIHADIAQLHPSPAPLIPLVAACCSPLYCTVHCTAAIPRCCPSASSIAPLCPSLPLPARSLPRVCPSPLLPVGSLPSPPCPSLASLIRRRGSHPSPAASSILTFLGWLGPQL